MNITIKGSLSLILIGIIYLSIFYTMFDIYSTVKSIQNKIDIINGDLSHIFGDFNYLHKEE